MAINYLPEPETRGIWSLGPWHPRTMGWIRAERRLSHTEPPSLGRFVVSLHALTENAMCHLDDVRFRAQADCEILSGMIDDIARINEYDIHRARFAALVAMPSRLEDIRVSTV